MAHALSESSTFTATVVVPDPGDDRRAASVEMPIQALTNRTLFLKDAVEGFADEYHQWGDTQEFKGPVMLLNDGTPYELGYAEGARERGQFLNPRPIVAPEEWTCAQDTGAWVTANNRALVFWIGRDVLPSNAIITRVQAAVSASTPCTLDLCRMVPATAPLNAYAPNGDLLEQTFSPSGTNEKHLLDLEVPGLEVRNYDFLHRVRLRPTAGGSTILFWMKVIFGDPGPRNF